MTKKDFELIAQVIQDAEIGSINREVIAEEFARVLRYENPRFDAERFKRACVAGANVRARS